MRSFRKWQGNLDIRLGLIPNSKLICVDSIEVSNIRYFVFQECGVCESSLKYGSLAVSASKLGLLYHATCFRCTDCKELLVDLAYCVHDDMLFCERHYAEQLKPRCAACDEVNIHICTYTHEMKEPFTLYNTAIIVVFRFIVFANCHRIEVA